MRPLRILINYYTVQVRTRYAGICLSFNILTQNKTECPTLKFNKKINKIFNKVLNARGYFEKLKFFLYTIFV